MCLCEQRERGSHVATACPSVSHPVTRLAKCVPLCLCVYVSACRCVCARMMQAFHESSCKVKVIQQLSIWSSFPAVSFTLVRFFQCFQSHLIVPARSCVCVCMCVSVCLSSLGPLLGLFSNESRQCIGSRTPDLSAALEIYGVTGHLNPVWDT